MTCAILPCTRCSACRMSTSHRKISLRKERDRQAEQEDQPCQRKTQEDQDQRASVRVSEIGEARGHFSFSSFSFPSFSFSSFSFSSLLRTCVPSGRL